MKYHGILVKIFNETQIWSHSSQIVNTLYYNGFVHLIGSMKIIIMFCTYLIDYEIEVAFYYRTKLPIGMSFKIIYVHRSRHVII